METDISRGHKMLEDTNGEAYGCSGCLITAFLAAVRFSDGGTGVPRYNFVDITPVGYPDAEVSAVQGGQALGDAFQFPNGTEVPMAGYWKGGASTFVNLTPTGYVQAETFGSDGTHQVGVGYDSARLGHALMRIGTASSKVDLSPPAPFGSVAFSISNGVEVGEINGLTPGNHTHAVAWTGTAASMVDVNPPGYSDSFALRNDGNAIVGSATVTGGSAHAGVWTGTGHTFADLNPPGFISSVAESVFGSQVVGGGRPTGAPKSQALLWSDSLQSVNLNPPGSTTSLLLGGNGYQQVGYADDGDGITLHACVWSGTAVSATDLSAFVPSGYTGTRATGIESDGTIIGEADFNGTFRAVEWTPVAVPEPGEFLASAFPIFYWSSRRLCIRRRLKSL